MILKYIFSGILIKIIASFDDFLTRIPLLAALTKTRKGKIAFCTGNMLALLVIILLAEIIAGVLNSLPHSNIISAGLIFIVAGLVYFDVLTNKSKRKKKIEDKYLKIRNISAQRFFKLIGIGFMISFLTLVDDAIVFAALFLNKDLIIQVWMSLGIILITSIQLFLIIYFSEKIAKLNYKKEIASLGMVIVGFLILLKII